MLIALLVCFPILAAPALFLLGRRCPRALDTCAGVSAGIELLLSAALLLLPESLRVPELLAGGLSFSAGGGGFGAVYGFLASLLWLGTTLFSREYFLHEPEHLPSYWALVFLTLGAVQGVFLSDNFMTAFIFFEILSLSSFPWVMHERTREAIRAGCTYLAVAVIGGLVLMMGLLLLARETGTLAFSALPAAVSAASPGTLRAAGICILLGFGAKAGLFPLHVWLPKAHPVAPAPASALLSGMLTKVGVFGVLMVSLYVLSSDRSFGVLLLTLALITMALGAVLALFSVNFKRTLACSSMSQIGFILTGVAASVLLRGAGEGKAVISAGTALHMTNHSLLKLVLFLTAGAAAMRQHTLDLNLLMGWGRKKPLLKLAFGIAALGISGVPLFNGYISKTLLHEELLEAIHAAGIWPGTEWVFLISGGMTFAYMLKLFLCLFVEKNADPARQEAYDADRFGASPLSAAVLLGGTAVLIPLGIPGSALSMAKLMTGEGLSHFAAFHWENLKGGLISLGIGAVLYLCFVRPVLCRGGVCRDLWPEWLDLENSFYRPLLLRWLPGILGNIARVFGENLVLRPLCRLAVLAGVTVVRAAEHSMDFVIMLLWRTVLREEKLRDEESLRRTGALKHISHAVSTALRSVNDSLSFAMMMTCVGIILIFVFLLLSV